MPQHLGQRTGRTRPRQGAAGIVSAVTFVRQERVEPAKRRGLARDGGARQCAPILAQRGERGCVRLREAPTQCGGRQHQVAPIRRYRVGRRTGFRGQHLEEQLDELRVATTGHRLTAHSRAIASAAIIRASPSSPTDRSAPTIRYSASGGMPRQDGVCMPTAASSTTVPGWPFPRRAGAGGHAGQHGVEPFTAKPVAGDGCGIAHVDDARGGAADGRRRVGAGTDEAHHVMTTPQQRVQCCATDGAGRPEEADAHRRGLWSRDGHVRLDAIAARAAVTDAATVAQSPGVA